MDDATKLLTHYIDTFWKVRGWRPRRIYVNTIERYHIACSSAAMCALRFQNGDMFDGCEIRQVFKPEVAAAIRAWDLS